MFRVIKTFCAIAFFAFATCAPAFAQQNIDCLVNECHFEISSPAQFADWTVPQGVTSIRVVVTGASGGTGGTGELGSLVGVISGELAVTPNTKIRFSPGAAGESASQGGIGGTNPAGGFAGGSGGQSGDATTSAGGGGSASVIFVSDKVIVAAGGGGGNGSAATGGGGGGASGGAAGSYAEATPTSAASGENRAEGLNSNFIEVAPGTSGHIEVTFAKSQINAVEKLYGNFVAKEPAATADFAIGAIALISAVSSSWLQPSNSEGEVETLENIETENMHIDELEMGAGDRLSIWEVPDIDFATTTARKLAHWSASRSSILTRLVTDAAYLRAIFGPLSLVPMLFLAGLGYKVGQLTLEKTSLAALPIAFILAIGIIDAAAGAIGISSLAIGLIFRFGLPDIGHVQYLLTLIATGFAPILAASAFRNFRRKSIRNGEMLWERLTDLFVVPFFVTLLVISFITSMQVFLRSNAPVISDLHQVKVAVVVASIVRIGLEEVAARYFPHRLFNDHDAELVEPNEVVLQKAVLIRTLLFFVVVLSFIGACWQLYLSTLLFFIPQFVALYNQKFPNSPRLWQILPGGVPNLLFGIALGSLTAFVLTQLFGMTSEMAKSMFVFAMIPSTVISILKSFARHPSEGDLRFYRRSGFLLIYRFAGVIVLGVTFYLSKSVF